MSRRILLLLTFLICMPAAVIADQQADDLYKQYQAAYAKNDLQTAVDLLCKAAKLDPASYGKKCEDAQQYYNSRVEKFESYFVSGKAKFEAKQYTDAITDLSKIYFGPRRVEAQQLIAQANDAINHPQPADNSPVALRASKNYPAAQQKYNAALAIKSNGPGNPSGKLQELAVLMKQPNGPASAPKDNSARINALLADARDHMAKGDAQGALTSYNQVLVLDPKQAEALSGRQQAQQAMQAALAKDPKALEDTLVRGVRDFYQSHLDDARDAISLYLTAGGTRSKGAAYFYLGATMLSEAILSDPKSGNHDRLRQDALQQFQQAKQQGFKPVEKYVSPKILAVWNQPGM